MGVEDGPPISAHFLACVGRVFEGVSQRCPSRRATSIMFFAAQDTFLKAHFGEGHLSRAQICSWSRVGTACWPTLFFVVLFSRLDVVIFSNLIPSYNVRAHLHMKLPIHNTFKRHQKEKLTILTWPASDDDGIATPGNTTSGTPHLIWRLCCSVPVAAALLCAEQRLQVRHRHMADFTSKIVFADAQKSGSCRHGSSRTFSATSMFMSQSSLHCDSMRSPTVRSSRD